MLKIAQLILIILTFYFSPTTPLSYSPAQENVEKFLRNGIRGGYPAQENVEKFLRNGISTVLISISWAMLPKQQSAIS
ncbi:MAG: hypothetical protein F6K48_16105 [Okeania sp. SIO3H1]|nr:hypothetical protein [Okeania sp. SIO3H1]